MEYDMKSNGLGLTYAGGSKKWLLMVSSHISSYLVQVYLKGDQGQFLSLIYILNDIVKANKYFPIRLFVGDTH